jgi:magnesium-transporting ATPase (P-type)
MIQRQQSLWLLLSTIAAIFSFMFPFVVGGEIIGKSTTPTPLHVDAASSFFLLILTGGSLILSTVIIFLFKNRRQQMLLCLSGVLLSVIIIILYIVQMNKLINPVLALSCIFPFLIVVGYFMAFRKIRKDEKLVKSLDKLR